MDDDTQIRVDGDVVNEVSIDGGEGVPAMDTMQMREAGRDASRHPSDMASGLAARLMKTRRPHRVSADVCESPAEDFRGRCSSWPSVAINSL